jgi:ankyrin repeat protein
VLTPDSPYLQAEETYLDSHPHERHLQAFFDLIGQGDVDVAQEVLVNHALDVNAFHPSQGLTALHIAAKADDSRAIQMLLRNGADKTLKSRDGHGLTAHDLAGASPSAGLLA